MCWVFSTLSFTEHVNTLISVKAGNYEMEEVTVWFPHTPHEKFRIPERHEVKGKTRIFSRRNSSIPQKYGEKQESSIMFASYYRCCN